MHRATRGFLTNPRWLAKRHGLGDERDQALNAMAAALDAIAKAATSSYS